jgi:disulfide bond formation protein DsbB
MLASAALLAVVAAIGLFGAVADPRGGAIRGFMLRQAQIPAVAVAAAAMLGSLYYSEIADFIPCEFCWYQRIAMYPIAIVLLVAVASRDRLPARFPVALAAAGLVISVYHYQLQLNPEQSTVCSGLGTPCHVQWVDEFGFVSIPFMAGCGFVAILMLYATQWRARRIGWDPADGGPEAG